ncbi:MAG: GTPase ObgE [Bacilli bacterium]
MFIDYVQITVKAGKGGDGAISFRREKYVDRGGPDGGRGGRGGSIYLVATTDKTTLLDYRYNPTFTATSGRNGAKSHQTGKSGEDLYLKVPVGTVVSLSETKEVLADLAEEGMTFLLAQGGRGGRGNASFKSAQVRVPRYAENGDPGEEKLVTLELKLLADVGLVGKPNAGKSTLLSVISNARPEIAAYPFTTIHPQLGVVEVDDFSFVVADMPGLIQGAAAGKGLGIKFLRHIERTRLLVHLVANDEGGNPLEDYQMIRQELAAYDQELAARPSIVVVSKADLDQAEQVQKILEQELKQPVFLISALTHQGIKELIYEIKRQLQEIPLIKPAKAADSYRVYDAREMMKSEPLFTIEKIAPHVYQIKGEEVIKNYRRHNLSDEDGISRLLYYLQKIGVNQALAKSEIADGDTVILDDFEFEYFR